MTEEHTTPGEVDDGRKPAEPAAAVAPADQLKPRGETGQPARYLWPSLMSLWQAGER